MTRREWADLCLQDSGCPDDMLDYHLARLGIGDEPWMTADDDANNKMMRHDERAAIRLRVEEYAVELHGAEPVVVADVMVGVFFAGGWPAGALHHDPAMTPFPGTPPRSNKSPRSGSR